MNCKGRKTEPWGTPDNTLHGEMYAFPRTTCYINDLPASISSKICLYADDVILNRTTLSSEDDIISQYDLKKLVGWAATWLTYVSQFR